MIAIVLVALMVITVAMFEVVMRCPPAPEEQVEAPETATAE